MPVLKINWKLFIALAFTFILMTVIGTVTHELGHYTVARLTGNEATLNYFSSQYSNPNLDSNIERLYTAYKDQIIKKEPFPEKELYDRLTTKYDNHQLLVLIGGPIQTMLTGTLGIILLLTFRRKVIVEDKVLLSGWILIFLSLFWLRQVSNLTLGILEYYFTGEPSYRGDEARIAIHYDINVWTIQIITGVLGITAFSIVLKLIPKHIWFTFLSAGLVGGAVGYYLWLYQLGQYILP
jgi:hypothetical protein